MSTPTWSGISARCSKAFTNLGLDAPLFFWRDATGHEIDVVIDLGDRLVPLEVRSAKTIASDTLEGLRWWTGLKENPNRTGVLVYGGTEASVRHGLTVRPWYLG